MKNPTLEPGDSLETKAFGVSIETLSAQTGEFSGLAIPFDSLHDSSAWQLDGWQDTVARNAFDETLAEHKAAGTMPLLQWMHQRGNIIGTITSAKATPEGVRVEGKVSPNAISPSGVPVIELLRTKAMGGLSIGFQVIQSSLDEKSKVRTIQNLAWRELSVVDIAGAGPTARITDVKSDPRSVETALRALGFSKKEAKVFVSAGISAVKDIPKPAPVPEPVGTPEELAATKVSRLAAADSDAANEASEAAGAAHGAATVSHAKAAASNVAAAHSNTLAAKQALDKGGSAAHAEFKAAADGHTAKALIHNGAASAMQSCYSTLSAPPPPEAVAVQIPDSSESLADIVKKFSDSGARRDAGPSRLDAGDRNASSILALTNDILDILKG